MNNQNRAAKRTDESGEHKSLRCFISTRGIPVETYKMAEDGRKWKALAIQRKQLHRELASWANADGKHACPSLASLVRATGYSRVTVWRRVQELESLGLLVSTGKSGYQGTADYTVVTPGASIVSDSQSDTQPIVSDSIPIVSDSMPKVSDSRPIVSPRRNPTVLPLNETEGGPAAACVAYARSTYRNKFHQEQTRRDDDLSSVEGLFKRKPDLATEEFKRRYNNCINSTETFTRSQGFSLKDFCGRFDAFLTGPLLDRSQRQPEKESPPPKGYRQKQREEEARQRAEAAAQSS